MGKESWWHEVEAIVEERSLLKHPFYRAWQEGRLSRDDLAYYAKQYYPQVRDFPRYLSAVHANTEDLKTRQILLENLNEEERGEENHPELWMRFAEGLGVRRDEVLAQTPNPETEACVETFHTLARENTLTGIAALYAYESQIPAVSTTKMQGLREFYAVDDERAHQFFKVHEKADEWHSRVEREILEALADTHEKREAVKASVRDACDAVNRLLDGVVRERGIAAAC